jgi:phosphotriesterase-related protein
MTVRGPLPAEELGFTLPHEHVLITHTASPADLTDPEAAVRELALYAAAGGKSLVDMTNVGLKRDPVALRSISERTGVNIIMGSGFYKHKWLPPATHERSVEDLATEIVRDIEVGADGTGIRAGIIGEIGISSTRQEAKGRTATEERVLRAAARAQRITGAGMNVHFDIGGDLAEHESVVDILEGEGADLRRVALSHFVPLPGKLSHFRRLAERGCFIEFDLFGLEVVMKRLPRQEEGLEVLRDLVAEGLAPHLLISQDLCFKSCLAENGGFGYAHILRNILPRLERLGVEATAIRAMTVENPRRLLALKPIAAAKDKNLPHRDEPSDGDSN